MPDHRNWHQENPNVGDHVRDVCEIGEMDQVEAVAFDRRIPESFDGPASETQRDCYTDSPGDDEGCGCDYDLAEHRNDEDSVIQGQNTELDEY